MTITKITHEDGSESIKVQIDDVVEVVSMTEWSKMIAEPRLQNHRTIKP